MSKNNNEGSCFWGHKWSKWEQYKQQMIRGDGSLRYYDNRQKRVCLRCNKMQDEII
jgi:hypothetical protein